MNGIEKITARITADAEEEIRAIQEKSENHCAEIKAGYDKKAQAEYWKIIQDGAKEVEDRSSRMDRTAKLEAKKLVLAMKQQTVSKAFDAAREMIVSLPEQDYVGFLARLASESVVTGQEELILNERDYRACGQKVVKTANDMLSRLGKEACLTLSDKTRPISGGLILKQGDIEVNCAVDTMLELSRGELAAQVAEVLFEG